MPVFVFGLSRTLSIAILNEPNSSSQGLLGAEGELGGVAVMIGFDDDLSLAL